MASIGPLGAFGKKYGEISGFPELVHFSNDVGQVGARQNVPNIAWNISLEKPNEPFYCERKYSEGWDFTEILKY